MKLPSSLTVMPPPPRFVDRELDHGQRLAIGVVVGAGTVIVENVARDLAVLAAGEGVVDRDRRVGGRRDGQRHGAGIGEGAIAHPVVEAVGAVEVGGGRIGEAAVRGDGDGAALSRSRRCRRSR